MASARDKDGFEYARICFGVPLASNTIKSRFEFWIYSVFGLHLLDHHAFIIAAVSTSTSVCSLPLL